VLLDLEFELQERVYDELELLADQPELLKVSHPENAAVHDVTFGGTMGLHYVFLTIFRDDEDRRLRIDAAGHVFKPYQS